MTLARHSLRIRYVFLGLGLAVLSDTVPAQTSQFVSEHRMWPFAGAVLSGYLDGGLAFGDLDGDSDLDAIVVGNGVEVYSNQGQGRFVRMPGSVTPPPHYSFSSVSLGDIDGDGDLDAVAGNGRNIHCWTGADLLLTNDGTGHFTSSGGWPAVGDCTHDVKLVDLNGDNLMEMVFASYDIDPCRVLQNLGAGQFANVTIPILNGCNAVVPADCDADGDLDLLFVSGLSRWLVNNGSFQFQLGASSLPGGKCAAFGDVDGDGDEDLVVGGANQVTLVRRIAPAQFQAVVGAFPTVSGTAHTVSLGDVDGDQDLDVLVGMEFAPGILFRNDGSGAFTPFSSNQFAPPNPSGISALVDVDSDGDLDAVVERALLLNDGGGRFVNVAGTSPQSSVSAVDAVTADFNGDGELDIAFGEYSLRGVGIYFGEGAGVFHDAVSQLANTHLVESIGAGDLDGDGDVDIVLGMDFETVSNYVLWNNGVGQFSPSNPAAFGSHASDVEIADLDGDGDLDVLLSAYASANVTTRLLINSGTGSFVSAPSQLPAVPLNQTHDLELADLDGNGTLDVWRAGYGQNTVWLNNGSAHFTALAGAVPFFLETSDQVMLGDFDGDLDIDAVAYFSPYILRLFLNDGQAHFSLAPLNVQNSSIGAVVAADFDGDGDLDICTSQWIHRNDGVGNFTSELLDGGAYLFNSSALVVADFDKDRDLDVFDGATGLWKNRTRDIAWRAVPRIGHPLTIDVQGPPNSPFRIAAATARLDTFLPPLGMLRLDTQAIRFTVIGSLDASGRGAISVQVPNDPILIGRTYYWQALVGTPMRLTGLEKTTFTGL